MGRRVFRGRVECCQAQWLPDGGKGAGGSLGEALGDRLGRGPAKATSFQALEVREQCHTLAEAKIDLKQGDWQRLHVESTGNKLVARLNGQELRGEDPYLTTARVRWWFAAGGDNVQLRKVRFSEGTALP